jgi:S-adenosylmethionine-diacylglycerol 3-amino-3-carboxypropyl transferase
MKLLRRWLTRVKGEALIRDLFEAESLEERESIYDTRWDTAAWRLFTRVFLSRRVMSLLFTGDFFTYVDGSFSFGRHFAARVRKALTGPSLKENYFASFILLGRFYDADTLPPYLRREHFRAIRSRLDRVELVTRSCGDFFEQCAESSIDKFNFTNIFEWMSPEAYERLLRQTWRVGAPGAVLTYRNLLVLRERPECLGRMFRREKELASALHRRDRSFIYRNYVVEIVEKEGTTWHTTSDMSAIVAA